jgi:ABC-2 type transport system permease protein/sodium transport system permease protein
VQTSNLPVPDPHERLQRLWRLSLKELREILRDRRTIFTLVLMPLLLYPLLTVIFQQFFAAHMGTVRVPHYAIGFRNVQEAQFLVHVLAHGGLLVYDAGVEPQPDAQGQPPKFFVEGGVRPELEKGLDEYDIQAGLRVKGDGTHSFDPRRDLNLDVEILYREDSRDSRDAKELLEKHLRMAGEKFLGLRLDALQVSQRAVPIHVTERSIEAVDESSATIQIAAIIPFVLILMTVTGAVYPAIDLTAGERERGTLEILVAAPIPRVGVLFAKYVAVLTVALLTAAANLLTMTLTISVSGLGKLLFGDAGISFGVIAAMLGLLLLFAAFFSALLLVITSSARSFKEAQAYLIPLMLLALAPGMLSLMPGLTLSGLLLVTPLANIVLLGRDLFAFKATVEAAVTVVLSTAVYAGAAIALAARVFGSESVLYSDQTGWSDLFRRPRTPEPAPTLTAALVCLAIMFPTYFALLNLLGRTEEIGTQLLAGVIITAIIFGAMPIIASWNRRSEFGGGFSAPRNALTVSIGIILVGLSLWTLDHGVVLLSQKIRGATLDPKIVSQAGQYAERLRSLPVAAIVMAFGIVPALFEEGFFRGYFYAALRTVGHASTAIIISSVVFGLFHVIAPNPLATERLISSTLTGLVLGWVRWRTGSVFPGMLLHCCHNGLLALLIYYEPALSARGYGVAQEAHLPAAWYAGGAVLVALGLGTVWAVTRSGDAQDAT